MRYLLHHLLQSSAERSPDGVAVVDGERHVTYETLERRSNQVANLLLDQGVGIGDRVGLYLEKSLEAIAGIYGVLKAGAAYVPLDPDAPTHRLAYIARDCGIEVMLTGAEKAGEWAGLLEEGAPLRTLVVLGGPVPEARPMPSVARVLGAESIDAQPDRSPNIGSIDLDLAYILYTSGSTGNPKGVMLSHRNALAFVEWAAERFAVRADDRLSSHAPLHFDLSVFDLFAAARAGASVTLVPRGASFFPLEVVRFIEDRRITIWYSVPSILTMLTLRGKLGPGSCPELRTILFAGEVFPTKYLQRLMGVLPHVGFFNLYGPTETNVCTYYEVPALVDNEAPIPIGEAIPNVEVFAVTVDGQQPRPGEEGELLVRGPTVMRGYWGDPERTARSLVPDPRGNGSRDTAYRTGDLVRADADGKFLLLGRRDHQIKSRGYRIELQEIESTLHAHPGVVECAVLAIPDELITNRIVACLVVRDGVSEAELARFCAGRIPRYMIPGSFELIDVLPKTSTGKIDRQALLEAHRMEVGTR